MSPADQNPSPGGVLRRTLRVLRPSHEHSAFSATVLLMAAVMASRVLGLVRESYIAWAFGALSKTDAYVAAFTLPEFVNYLLAGGTASITFVAMLTRYGAEKREAEAQKAFSIIVTVVTVLLGLLIAVATILTPQFTRWWFKNFSPDEVQLCVHLTRILLPVQAFFVVGGVISAVLQWKRQFLFPALTPILYNLGIILGGVLLRPWLGIESLAWGALGGAVIGAFLINVIGARRSGLRYRPSLDVFHPAFLEWLWLSIPLMLGVSLVFFDDPIMRRLAPGVGDIARLNYAKRLFAVPAAVIGQAAGQASLPFFARLFGEKRFGDFDRAVNTAVYRTACLAVLGSGWLMAAALPVVDLVYRIVRGRFQFADSQATALLLFGFAISLVFWAAQGLYARAYYAAGDTLTPMIAGTVITAASYPVYKAMFHHFGVIGLPLASNIGIAVHTLALVLLLNRKKLVRVATLPWLGFAKVLGTAVFAGTAGYFVAGLVQLNGSRKADAAALGLVSVTWAAAVAAGLWITRSELPSELRRRRASTPPAANVISAQQPEVHGGVEL